MGRGARGPKATDDDRIVLRVGREKPAQQRHPWLFSGAIESIGARIEDGAITDVCAADGHFIARAYVNRRSQILARLLTWDPEEHVDEQFWSRRVHAAVRRRAAAGAARLVNAENDGLPGLIVDRYGDYCVISSSTLGIDCHKSSIIAALADAASPRGIYERSDVDGREKEGITPVTGNVFGDEPPELIRFSEASHGREVELFVDVRRGHKTGTYLDQSENRRRVAAIANGAEVLNLFSYTGAFAVHAAAGGARRVVNVDSSAEALALSERVALENGYSDRVDHVREDAFLALRNYRDEGRSFDVVIVDPPKFVHSSAQVDRAARAYKDLNRLAFSLIRPGGYLAAFSCSGLVSADLFQKIVWSASLEAGRDAQIVERLGQASDHPVRLSFPEGEYLKGLICRVP